METPSQQQLQQQNQQVGMFPSTQQMYMQQPYHTSVAQPQQPQQQMYMQPQQPQQQMYMQPQMPYMQNMIQPSPMWNPFMWNPYYQPFTPQQYTTGTQLSKVLNNINYQSDPKLFMIDAEDSFKQKYVTRYKTLMKKYNTTNNIQEYFTFNLQDSPVFIEPPPKEEDNPLEYILEQCCQDDIILPYFTVRLIKTKEQIKSIQEKCEKPSHFLPVWFILHKDKTTTSSLVASSSEDKSLRTLSSPPRSASVERGRKGKKKETTTTTAPTIQQCLDPNRSISPDDFDIQVEREELKPIRVNELFKIIEEDPKIIFKVPRVDQIGAQPQSISYEALKQRPDFQQYIPLFSSIDTKAALQGLIQTFRIQVDTPTAYEFYETTSILPEHLQKQLAEAAAKSHEDITQDQATIFAHQLTEYKGRLRPGYENILNSPKYQNMSQSQKQILISELKANPYFDTTSDIPPFAPIHLASAMSLATDTIAISDQYKEGPHMFELKLTYSSLPDSEGKSSIDEVTVAHWNINNVDQVIQAVYHSPIYNSKLDYLESIGSDSRLLFDTQFLTNQLTINYISLHRVGGNNTRILSTLLDLLSTRIKEDLGPNITLKKYKSKDVYEAELQNMTILAPLSKGEHDCFFSSLLLSDTFMRVAPSKIPLGLTAKGEKNKRLTAIKLREHYNNIMESRKNDRGPVSIENATKYLMRFNIYLVVLNENNETINKETSQKENTLYGNDNTTIVSMMFFQNHYFLVKLQKESYISILSDYTTSQQKEAATQIGHTVTVELLAYFDLETIYNSKTILPILSTYSNSYLLEWGKIKAKVNANSLNTYSKLEDAINNVKKSSSLLDTNISKEASTQNIISDILLAISKYISDSYEMFEPIVATGAVYELNIKTIFIAFNGSRFDFIPLFVTLDSLNYKFNQNVPVRPGKMSKFSFYGPYKRMSTVMPKALPSVYSYDIPIKYEYTCWDPRNFVTGSLDFVAKNFRLPLSKLLLDHNLVQSKFSSGEFSDYIDDNYKKIKEYNERDVVLLREITTILREEFSVYNVDCFNYPTLPAQSYYIANNCRVIAGHNIRYGETIVGIKHCETTIFDRIYANESIVYPNIDDLFYDPINDKMDLDEANPFMKNVIERNTPEMDKFIRKAIVAGRVSGGIK